MPAAIQKAIPTAVPPVLPRPKAKLTATPDARPITDEEEIECYLIGVRDCLTRLPRNRAVSMVIASIDRALGSDPT
jgi:hypothetical protein